MERQMFSWQLKDNAGDVVDDGTRFAWNSAIRAGQDALRDVPGRGMFERDGSAVHSFPNPRGDSRIGDTYAQRWTGPRGTFTVEVMCGLAFM